MVHVLDNVLATAHPVTQDKTLTARLLKDVVQPLLDSSKSKDGLGQKNCTEKPEG